MSNIATDFWVNTTSEEYTDEEYTYKVIICTKNKVMYESVFKAYHPARNRLSSSFYAVACNEMFRLVYPLYKDSMYTFTLE